MSANLNQKLPNNQPSAQEISKWRFVLGLRNPDKRKEFEKFIEEEIQKRREWIKTKPIFLVKGQLKDWADDMGQKADKIKDRFPKAADVLYVAREKCIELLTEIEDQKKD